MYWIDATDTSIVNISQSFRIGIFAPDGKSLDISNHNDTGSDKYEVGVQFPMEVIEGEDKYWATSTIFIGSYDNCKQFFELLRIDLSINFINVQNNMSEMDKNKTHFNPDEIPENTDIL